mmetsp:Transcript_30127/g.47207  ORF Transcript_30127/g.47207 Transcript_30127/m.47207 type:complete len:105 (+) Transcript_30127:1006-1320(+)
MQESLKVLSSKTQCPDERCLPPFSSVSTLSHLSVALMELEPRHLMALLIESKNNHFMTQLSDDHLDRFTRLGRRLSQNLQQRIERKDVQSPPLFVHHFQHSTCI